MIGEQVGGVVRSDARREFGELIPVRPATGRPTVCLRGHRLDFDLYGKLAPYSHRYRLHATLCEVCRAWRAATRPSGVWPNGLTSTSRASALPTRRPAKDSSSSPVHRRTGPWRARSLSTSMGSQVATATLSICVPCWMATLDYVHVAAGHRRLGYGRTLVAAALARAPAYRWTAPLPTGPVAQSFRARIAMRRTGPPCAHRGGDDFRR
ncbi:GNAT family N-acetyltransferase [Amycolatopsis sp. NPDC051371]|uniref:GNAT family N-acetyltransferase n=1 Tax=Amycolatopsis sp. NPDC051371 TaxID=3155800 RepID=UPI003442D395